MLGVVATCPVHAELGAEQNHEPYEKMSKVYGDETFELWIDASWVIMNLFGDSNKSVMTAYYLREGHITSNIIEALDKRNLFAYYLSGNVWETPNHLANDVKTYTTKDAIYTVFRGRLIL
jgi:hypothetical protein